MRLDPTFIEDLKSRCRLSDVVARSVTLKRRGREYVGLSPFAKERTPSFFVNDDKGRFFDFSSGRTGDVIGFLQEIEHLSFREAVEKLAAEVGLALPADSRAAAAAERQRGELAHWLEEAAKWFEGRLRRPEGEGACAYLEQRGLTACEQSRFRLGYAPRPGSGLRDHLLAKGARPSALVAAGLLVASEDGSRPFDRFRNRIIFPIADARGRVVSFAGRALEAGAAAKYINGPETPLFRKGRTLYGLHTARSLLREPEGKGGFVVVEGYLDVIACQRLGVAAVAPMGTTLSELQMEALWRLDPEPTLCFDGDPAGRRAAWRTLDRTLPLLSPERSFKFAQNLSAKDPDEVLRTSGEAALRRVLSAARPFVGELFECERARGPLSTPESWAALRGRLRAQARKIRHRELAGLYEEALMARLAEERRAALRCSRLQRGGRPHPQGAGGASQQLLAAASRLRKAVSAAEEGRGLRRPATLSSGGAGERASGEQHKGTSCSSAGSSALAGN